MNSTNIDYDYYFALGYETKDAIDLFLIMKNTILLNMNMIQVVSNI